jgi:Reverse transcriptase (RNA-dependent DNA polymerase)
MWLGVAAVGHVWGWRWLCHRESDGRGSQSPKWSDCEGEEGDVGAYESLTDQGLERYPGLQPSSDSRKKINVHFVFACKHNGHYKARLVTGGHLTDTPIDSVYSSVASLRGVRIVMFLAELNDYLNFWSTDIGNAYLESDTMEKIYIIGGKEFECIGMQGHTLVIVKALYGLKSSGMRWWGVLADVLRQMGFVPSKADPNIWMRPKQDPDNPAQDHYEYIMVYVDDLGIASKAPEGIVKELEERYGFNLKGTGPTTFHRQDRCRLLP